MSMHFAPQWVKPIKPAGHSTTPSLDAPPKLSGSSAPAFPALRSSSPSTNPNPSNPPLSYSKITHTPQSPNFPTDSSYFPYPDNAGNANGNGTGSGTNPHPHPFRYSREEILSLWDHDKFKARPIELVELAEGGTALVAPSAGRPVGLRDLQDAEKQLLSTSVNPPIISRRQPTQSHPVDSPTQTTRRTMLPPANGKEPIPNGRTAFGSFGGGKPFGGVLSPAGPVGDGKTAGFAGVKARVGQETAGRKDWRPIKTGSGTFEGVLGFGNFAPTSTPQAHPTSSGPESPISVPSAENRWQGQVAKEKDSPIAPGKEETPSFGNGGGPGWGTGQRKWRTAAALNGPGEGEKALRSFNIPVSNLNNFSESVIATPSATPVPERDATVLETTPVALNRDLEPDVQAMPESQPAEKEDLGAVEWLYRDPGGLEQGPFTGNQMHDWYSQSYFTDDLPVRRAVETSFHTLAELKTATANAVQPFLSVVRPRNLPPNLPIPLQALQHGQLVDQFKQMGMASPGQPQQNFASPIQNQYYQPQTPMNAHLPSALAWTGLPRTASYGSGVPSPIGAPLNYIPQPIYSPVIGGPAQRAGNDFFSPSVGVGAIPPSPWGVPQVPQPHPQQPYQQAWQTAPPPVPQQYEAPAPVDEPSYFPQETVEPSPAPVLLPQEEILELEEEIDVEVDAPLSDEMEQVQTPPTEITIPEPPT
ncbi:hypothetical protein P7C73_g6302, partial [Tremellales sp. Uapishka_1]